MSTSLVLAFVSSVLASLVGSFSGGGISLIIFPLLLIIAPGAYTSLLTTSKVCSTVSTWVSGKIHWGRQVIDRKLLAVLVVCGLIGTAVGTYLVQYKLNEELFKMLLAIILIAAAVYLLFSKRLGIGSDKPETVTGWLLMATILFSLVINVFNGLFGGTGIFITLFLVVVFKLSFIQSIAYSLISYAIINVFQTSYLLATETVNLALTLAVLAGSLVGTLVGTHLQYLKGNKWVKAASILVMLSLGVKMLW